MMMRKELLLETRKAHFNRLLAVGVCLAFVFGLTILPGCSSSENADALRDRMSSSESSYEHEEDDGHVHMYNHNLKDDTYICSECGKEYEGNPDDLVEV